MKVPPETMIGSPPQAWGRRDDVLRYAIHDRFTPTGVGTASVSPCARSLNAVHPHRRGDGGLPPAREDTMIGSPPQAWGRPVESHDLRDVSRFTPTGVGTATWARVWLAAVAVHPHRRGDGVRGYPYASG